MQIQPSIATQSLGPSIDLAIDPQIVRYLPDIIERILVPHLLEILIDEVSVKDVATRLCAVTIAQIRVVVTGSAMSGLYEVHGGVDAR